MRGSIGAIFCVPFPYIMINPLFVVVYIKVRLGGVTTNYILLYAVEYSGHNVQI